MIIVQLRSRMGVFAAASLAMGLDAVSRSERESLHLENVDVNPQVDDVSRRGEEGDVASDSPERPDNPAPVSRVTQAA